MRLGAGLFHALLSGAILVLLPAGGPSRDDPTKVRVTLTVTRIRGVEHSAKELEGEFKGQEVRYVVLACDAVIDNQTGEDLTVTSSFFSAFDGLSVQLLRDGRKVGEQHYTAHQSPGSPDPRSFVLKKGKNPKDMRILFRLPPADWAGLRARLVGGLPGSTFQGKLESNAVNIQRVTDFGP
jgi:hypothetical protein